MKSSKVDTNVALPSLPVRTNCDEQTCTLLTGSRYSEDDSQESTASASTVDSEGSVAVPGARKRQKLTTDEKDERERVKMAKKQKQMEEREEKRLAKEREKEAKLKEREHKKLQVEKQKAVKKADNMSNRSDRKDLCVEHTICLMEPNIMCLNQYQYIAEAVLGLRELGARCQTKHFPIPNSIGWAREHASYSVGEDAQLQKNSQYTEEGYILILLQAEELARKLEAQINPSSSGDTLDEYIVCLKSAYPDMNLTVGITGLESYYKLAKRRNERAAQEPTPTEGGAKSRKRKGDDVPLVGKYEIDSAIMRMQLLSGISVRTVCSPDVKGFASLVVTMTKAIAEAPFKLSKEGVSALQFLAPGDKTSVKICHDGQGITEAWGQMLQQFHQVGSDAAATITAAHPSPLQLMQQYRLLPKTDGRKLLQDLQISRGFGALATSRRIGPELSARVHKLLTSLDGDEPLAKT